MTTLDAIQPLMDADVDNEWPYFAGMREQRTLFASWEIPADVVRPLVPSRLTLDTHDGQTFVTTVALHMHEVHVFDFPAAPGFQNFEELNLRTYVRYEDTPGIYFISIDTSSTAYAIIARHMFHLPIHTANMNLMEVGSALSFGSERHHSDVMFEAGYEPTGTAAPAKDGSIQHFLCERYSYFDVQHNVVVEGSIRHAPWEIQKVNLTADASNLFTAAGIDKALGEPAVAFYAEQTDSVSRLPRKIV